MSAYLKFFELEQSPFEGKAQAQVVLGTRALRDAFSTIQTGLEEGTSRICVNGEPGLGKTSLARALPKLLGEPARVALILDPTISWEACRGRLAKQWGLASGGLPRAHLVEAARDRRLILVIDQAEKASEEFLDHLDVLLSYRSEDYQPVVQSVLLARLATRDGEAPSPLVWWLDRIQTLQLEFAPLPRGGIESYIHKHLRRAGWTGDRLFSEDAAGAIHGYSGGVPGQVSALCEKLLGEAAARNLSTIDADFVHSICDVEGEEEAWTLGRDFVEIDASPQPDAKPETAIDTRPEAPPAPDSEKEYDSAAETGYETDEVAADDTRAESEVEASEAQSLALALEHFRGQSDVADPKETGARESGLLERDEADEESEIDAASAGVWPELDPLDAPPTEDELREILGSGLARNLRMLALAVLAAVLGGIGLAIQSGETESVTPDLSNSLARTAPKTNRTPRAIVEPSLPRLDESVPAEDTAPLISIERGAGFVPIETLTERRAAQSDTEPSIVKLVPTPIPREQGANLEPFSRAPAAPAASDAGGADEASTEERFW